MSPPIREGSGDSIGSIRLGDGTEISEVRTGAGDVVFSGTTVIESFEDNDISNYSGSVSDFQITSSPVFDGDFALEETFIGNTSTSIFDPNLTISEDEVYQAAIRPVKNKITAVLFMAQNASKSDSYRVGYFHDNDEFRTPVGTVTVNVSVPDQYIIEFEKLSNGTVNCRLLDTNQNQLASTTGTDNRFTSGGLGFFVNNVNTNNGGSAAYDFVVKK